MSDREGEGIPGLGSGAREKLLPMLFSFSIKEPVYRAGSLGCQQLMFIFFPLWQTNPGCGLYAGGPGNNPALAAGREGYS